jgi:hypothetical protein
MDAGREVRMASKSARFSSLKSWDKDRMEVNQVFGSVALGLISPFAIAKTRSQINS